MWQSEERFEAKGNYNNLPTWMLKCPFHMPYLTEYVWSLLRTLP
jgi:hypothetical protein